MFTPTPTNLEEVDMETSLTQIMTSRPPEPKVTLPILKVPMIPAHVTLETGKLEKRKSTKWSRRLPSLFPNSNSSLMKNTSSHFLPIHLLMRTLPQRALLLSVTMLTLLELSNSLTELDGNLVETPTSQSQPVTPLQRRRSEMLTRKPVFNRLYEFLESQNDSLLNLFTNNYFYPK